TEDSQFFVTSKPTPSSLQKSDICAISSNSAGLTVGTLCTGIKFGSTVHPIILPSIEVYGTKNYTYSIVATDDKTVIAGFRMIYEIPVKIIGLSMVNGVEKVRTSRIFFHRSGAAAEPIELKWGILVAHDTSPGRPILVGMNATTIRKTSFEHIEEHTLIEPFSQWIGRALT
uniref:Uncharacterized protein n=1 Tax=Romanomermis culicivorax TaxID=13658 RepID=A0A915ISH2_ROMCU